MCIGQLQKQNWNEMNIYKRSQLLNRVEIVLEKFNKVATCTLIFTYYKAPQTYANEYQCFRHSAYEGRALEKPQEKPTLIINSCITRLASDLSY